MRKQFLTGFTHDLTHKNLKTPAARREVVEEYLKNPSGNKIFNEMNKKLAAALKTDSDTAIYETLHKLLQNAANGTIDIDQKGSKITKPIDDIARFRRKALYLFDLSELGEVLQEPVFNHLLDQLQKNPPLGHEQEAVVNAGGARAVDGAEIAAGTTAPAAGAGTATPATKVTLGATRDSSSEDGKGQEDGFDDGANPTPSDPDPFVEEISTRPINIQAWVTRKKVLPQEMKQSQVSSRYVTRLQTALLEKVNEDAAAGGIDALQTTIGLLKSVIESKETGETDSYGNKLFACPTALGHIFHEKVWDTSPKFFSRQGHAITRDTVKTIKRKITELENQVELKKQADEQIEKDRKIAEEAAKIAAEKDKLEREVKAKQEAEAKIIAEIDIDSLARKTADLPADIVELIKTNPAYKDRVVELVKTKIADLGTDQAKVDFLKQAIAKDDEHPNGNNQLSQIIFTQRGKWTSTSSTSERNIKTQIKELEKRIKLEENKRQAEAEAKAERENKMNTAATWLDNGTRVHSKAGYGDNNWGNSTARIHRRKPLRRHETYGNGAMLTSFGSKSAPKAGAGAGTQP